MPVIRLLLALTIIVVIGYFVLLSSERTEGRMKTFGRVLAIWLFVLPALALIAAAAHGGRHGGWRMTRHWQQSQPQKPTDDAVIEPPTTPASPDAGVTSPPPPAR